MYLNSDIGISLIFLQLIPDNYFPAKLSHILIALSYGSEFLLGYLIGSIGKFLMAAVDIGGNIMGVSSGLSMATVFNPSQNSQGSIIAMLLSMATLTSFLMIDGHHWILHSLIKSYTKFNYNWLQPQVLANCDVYNLLNSLAQMMLELGLRLSIPILIFNIILQIALGILGKLVPQIQVFFLGLPLQIFVSLWVLMITMGATITFFNFQAEQLYKLISF